MIWIVFILAGIAAGLFSGLLGVGGGTVIVPVLILVLSYAAGFPPDMIIKAAIATSFATMVFTTLNSVRVHHLKRAVRWDLVYKMLPGLLMGTLAGSLMVHSGESYILQLLFALFILFIGIRMLLKRKVNVPQQELNLRFFHSSMLATGFLSGLFGIGGGTFNVPNLHRRGLTTIKAIATAATVGWPIAVVGCLVLLLKEPAKEIPLAIGYVYLPAFVGITVTSIFFSGLGARLAHRLPDHLLKTLFAVFLVIVGVRLLIK
ncbi:MAG TPA: sulfite exporter TauE/SafE family protein [Cellvibrio sp.]|nr:sulfite exporter TauE/SafE family protein [Cellvibrio sp.]